jgi:hypothetical protein
MKICGYLKNGAGKFIMIFLISLSVLASGCASAVIETPGQRNGHEAAAGPPVKKELPIGGDAVVVRAKRLTKLELKKQEAVRINNRESLDVFVGAAAAVAAFTATGAALGSNKTGMNEVASFFITAAVAYISAYAAGFIYDMFTKD